MESRAARFLVGVMAWLCASLLALVLLDALSLEIYFVLAFIGFLFVTMLTAPVLSRPRWRRRLTWPIALGLSIFGVIVIREVYARLGGGVLF